MWNKNGKERKKKIARANIYNKQIESMQSYLALFLYLVMGCNW